MAEKTIDETEYSNEIRALYHFLKSENKEEISIDEITDMEHDFYGADMLEINGEEYAVCSNDSIERVFHDYAEETIDECVLGEISERYRAYFDYDKFIRDMYFDGYGQMSGYDGNDNEIEVEDEIYHIFRMN